jgi:hypothetical protein
MTEKNFGRDDLMVLAAFRYCLGRQTYIVSDCADWLVEQWENIGESTRKLIQRELEEAFKQDDEARIDNQFGLKTYWALGADCDRRQWGRVRLLYLDAGQPT